MKSTLCLFVCLGLSLPGCGKPDPVPSPGLQEAGSLSDHAFKPFVVRAREENPALPNTETPNDKLVADSSGSVLFEEVIVASDASDSKRYFLAWDSNALGSPIRHAFFEHQVFDEENRPRGEWRRSPVSRDPDTGRWFIDLADLAGGTLENADPAETLWANVEFHLQDRVTNIRVGLRIRGPIPSVQVQDLLGPAKFGMQGNELPTEEAFQRVIFNPSPRKLLLWVENTPADLDLYYYFRVPTFRTDGQLNGTDLVVHEGRAHYSAVARPWVRAVRMEREGTSTELSGSEPWLRIEIGAFESVRLTWMLDASRAHCARPGDLEIVFRYETEREVCRRHVGDGSECETIVTSRETRRLEHWELVGYRLKGSLPMRLWVGDSHSQLGEDPAWTREMAFKSQGRQEIDQAYGEPPYEAALLGLDCRL